MSGPKIYNINAGASFVDVLAQRYLNEYTANPAGLAEVLFLLPNRRACQSLAEAFVRANGLTPTILPQMKPLAEADEDEVYLTNNSSILENLLPPVDTTEKILQFTKLIMKKSELGLDKISLAQAYSLAMELSQLMDMVYNEELSFADIADLVGQEYAVHWQQTLLLLQIITENWPKILQENKRSDAIQRRNSLLRAELEIWQKTQTEQRIVVAGTTAAFPILKKLVKTVLNLPNGEVYLYGLDRCLEPEAWQKIDENHPQYELKELLEFLDISRDSIADIGAFETDMREKIAAEVMRPAETSSQWRLLSENPLSAEDFNHIKMLNCDDLRQEAQSIALIIRHTLETPQKTAALVTMDRNLSRRVVSELQKWNIAADDSVGKPLSLCPIGIYLQLICQAIATGTHTAIITLLKHPFTSCGKNRAEFNQKVRQLELAWRQKNELTADLQEFLAEFQHRIQPLSDLYFQSVNRLHDLFVKHIEVAESLADTDIKSGAQIIWKNDAGNVAAKWVAEFIDKCAVLKEIKTNDYASFLALLLSGQSVRNRYGTHPRVKILGPIEARLTQYDVTIIGEANEGIWPKLPEAGMWMSRPMQKKYGLPLPERQIGVAAADFAHLLNAPKVYITRAKKVGKDPMTKSRWWLRLETVLKANFGAKENACDFIYDQPYSYWAKHLDNNGKYCPIFAPEPRPEVTRRPTKISATNIERWMRNPYEIYAKYVLRLYKLDDLDLPLQPYEYGNIVHDVLNEFNNTYNSADYPAPEVAYKMLIERGREMFAAKKIPPEISAFWWPKYESHIKWIVSQETDSRQNIKQLYNEVYGKMIMPSVTGDFTIEAKADRIELLDDGTLNIVDYKTGNDSRTIKEVKAGKAPQLPVEGLIAASGGFENIAAADINSFQYWAIKDMTLRLIKSDDCAAAMSVIEQTVSNLINCYARQEQAYLVKPRPSDINNFSDYDHLSRLQEWCVHADSAED